MESSRNVPAPCHWNTVSVTTAPPRIEPMSSAVTVVSGMSALRSACRRVTVQRGTPFAHDTDDHGQDQCDQHRECDQPDGLAEPVDHLRADVDPRHDRRPEVAAEDPDDPVPVPGEEGLVEVQAYAL